MRDHYPGDFDNDSDNDSDSEFCPIILPWNVSQSRIRFMFAESLENWKNKSIQSLRKGPGSSQGLSLTSPDLEKYSYSGEDIKRA